MQTLLQDRLAEPEGVLKHAEGYDDNARLFIQLRQAEAIVKESEKVRDELKAQVDALVLDGEYIGVPELGYYTLGEPSDTVTFDWKKAAMDGLFNTAQAEPYITRKPKKRSLLFKPTKDNKAVEA